MIAYTLSLAGTDVVWKPGNISWVTHENGSLDGIQGRTGESLASTSAERIIHDLATLRNLSSFPFFRIYTNSLLLT